MFTVQDLTESVDTTSGALKIWVPYQKKVECREQAVLCTLFVDEFLLLMVVECNQLNNFIASFNNNQSTWITNKSICCAGLVYNLSNKNSAGGVVGRIEGENSTQFTSNPKYLEKSISGLCKAAELTQIEALSSNFSGGWFGSCSSSSQLVWDWGPVLPFRYPAGCGGGYQTASPLAVYWRSYALDLARERKQDYIDFKALYYGVTYESGAGD